MNRTTIDRTGRNKKALIAGLFSAAKKNMLDIFGQI
jgi:hypothetical protein